MGLFGKKDEQARIKEELAKMQSYRDEAERQMALLQARQAQIQPVQQHAPPEQLPALPESMESSKAPVERPFDVGAEEKQVKEQKVTLDQWLYTIVVNLEEIKAILAMLLPKKEGEGVKKKGGRPPKKSNAKHQVEDEDESTDEEASDSE